MSCRQRNCITTLSPAAIDFRHRLQPWLSWSVGPGDPGIPTLPTCMVIMKASSNCRICSAWQQTYTRGGVAGGGDEGGRILVDENDAHRSSLAVVGNGQT